jgi:stage V sporulation protein B
MRRSRLQGVQPRGAELESLVSVQLMLSRSVALNLLGGLTSLAVGFATSVILANWLGPASRGLLAIMITAATVGVAVAGLGLPMAVMYFASRDDADRPAIFGGTLLYGVVLAAVAVPLVWLVHAPLARLLAGGHGGRVWILAGAAVPLVFLDWTTHNQLLGKLRFGLYNALVFGSKVATLALAVVLVGVLSLGVAGGIVATMGASVVMIAGSLPSILGDGLPRLDGALFRRLASYGVRVQVGTLLQLLNYRLDVIVLGLFVPLARVGVYFVAALFAELVVTVANAFQSSVLPLVSHYEGRDEQRQTTVDAVRHHTFLALIATAANAVFSPLVILVVLSHGYRSALLPFFILLPSMVLLGAATVVAGDLRGRGRPGLTSVYSGVAVVVTIVLDFALIPPFGVVGAAVASVCAYAAYGIVSLRGLARVTGIPLRKLVVPTRADLALYRTRLRRHVFRPKLTEA